MVRKRSGFISRDTGGNAPAEPYKLLLSPGLLGARYARAKSSMHTLLHDQANAHNAMCNGKVVLKIRPFLGPH